MNKDRPSGIEMACEILFIYLLDAEGREICGKSIFMFIRPFFTLLHSYLLCSGWDEFAIRREFIVEWGEIPRHCDNIELRKWRHAQLIVGQAHVREKDFYTFYWDN